MSTYAPIVEERQFTRIKVRVDHEMAWQWAVEIIKDGAAEVVECGTEEDKPDAAAAARQVADALEARLAAEVEQARQAEEARVARIKADLSRLMETRRLQLVEKFGMIPPPAGNLPTQSFEDATKEAGKAEIWRELAADAIDRLRYVETDARGSESVPDECTAKIAADLRSKIEAGLIGQFVDVGVEGRTELVSVFQIGDFVEPLESKVADWRALKPAERGKIAFVYAACERASREGKTLEPVAIETYRSREWGMKTSRDAKDTAIAKAFRDAADRVAADWYPMLSDMIADANGKPRGLKGGRPKAA